MTNRIFTRRKMDYREKEFLLAHLIRMPQLLMEAKSVLKLEHFDLENDEHYAAVWYALSQDGAGTARCCVGNKYDNTGPEDAFPVSKLSLELGIRRAACSVPELALDEFKEKELFGDDGFLNWCYNLPSNDLDEDQGRVLLADFLEERVVAEQFKALASHIGEDVPSNMSDLIKDLDSRLQSIKSIGADPIQSAFPDEWTPSPISIFPTNIQFLDQLMDGGQAPGEVSIILGPTGVGKTTLGVKLVVEGARYQQLVHSRDRVELGHWFYFTYEAPVEPELRYRIWSYAAKIHRDSLWKMRSLGELSTSGNLKHYEALKYADELSAGVQVAGELERWQAARAQLKPNLWLVDMSGSDPANPKIGSHGVEEIARYLRRKASQGMKIAGYVIDYAGVAVDRYMAENKIRIESKRNYLSSFVSDCVRLLSGPFQAAGWVLHQLSGVANSKVPTAKPSHTDAAECKTMADAAWFAFNLGTKDMATSTCQITCSKTRRAVGDAKERIIHINGAFCDMTSADNRFSLDPRSKRIVPTDDLKKIMGSHNARKPLYGEDVRSQLSGI